MGRPKKRTDLSPVIANEIALGESDSVDRESTAPIVGDSARALKPQRLSFNLDGDDAAWESMHDSSKEKLKKIIAINSGRVAPMEPAFSVDDAKQIWQGLSSFEQWAVAKFMGVPGDIAALAFTLTDDELEALSGPTAAVLSKHLTGSSLLKYREEFMLLMAVGSVVKSQMARLDELMRLRVAELAAAEANAQNGHRQAA